MFPAPSSGLFLAVIVIFLLVIVGAVAIAAAVNELTARVVGKEVGCLVGGVAALGWVWLLARVEDADLRMYAAVLIGIPLTLTGVVRFARARGVTRPPT